jgi:hypothetical protein
MRITGEEARERLECVLKTVGIKMSLNVNTQAGFNADIEFPDGSWFLGDLHIIECDGISHRRG